MNKLRQEEKGPSQELKKGKTSSSILTVSVKPVCYNPD